MSIDSSQRKPPRRPPTEDANAVRFKKAAVDAAFAAGSEKNHTAKSQGGLAAGKEIKRIGWKAEPLLSHPEVLKLFPVLGADIKSMMSSIARDGQMAPVIVVIRKDGTRYILDGMTRYLACRGLKTECLYVEILESDLGRRTPVEWSVALNVASKSGRQLNDSQRGILAARLVLTVFAVACRKNSLSGKAVRNGEKGTANKRAAAAVGVKENRVRQSLSIIRTEFLVEAVWRGDISISKAAAISKLPDIEQQDALAQHLGESEDDYPELNMSTNGQREEKAAPKNVILKDALKCEVPETLISVFKARPDFSKTARTLKKLDDWLGQIRGSDLGRGIPSAAIGKLLKAVENAAPFAVCPDWELHKPDEKCKTCKNHGWMTRLEYEHFRESNKEKRR